ncbi:GNAT family N-acetyltransferase [Georgenia sp. AZ-5]|uniref:GNAT family N-acetyltransferase n=1 Tax=Georgenia sp. AZ-5 TaxID=3367526 RepID=UPI0037540050
MTQHRAPGAAIDVRPLDAGRWPNLERLFTGRGDQSRCWCAWWRLPGKEFGASRVADRRELMAARARHAPAPGLIAYAGEEPVGWVAVAPRAEYPRVQRSTIITYDDAVPGCWSITCFFVHPRHRGGGLLDTLVAAAVAHAGAHGAAHVEAYPVEPAPRQSASGLFRGPLGVFLRAGFTEVGRRQGRPTVRLSLLGG